MKKESLLFLLCLGVAASLYSQNEFVLDPKPSSSQNIIVSACKENGHSLAVVLFYSAIEGVSFETATFERIVSQKYDPVRGYYTLCLNGTDDDCRWINIDIIKPGYEVFHMPPMQIKNGEYKAYKLSPKFDESKKDNVAQITVYGKDGKPLEGAKLLNKATGITELTNSRGVGKFELKDGERLKVEVSHSYYGDKHLVIISSNDKQRVTLSHYISPKLEKTSAMWYIVPGLGQIELGNRTEGWATIAGETMLLGGGIVSSVFANKQLEIMRDVDVSLEDFMTAKSKYNNLKVVNVACYVGAAALYGFHIYRVYNLTKKVKSQNYASFTPAILNTNESLAFGMSMNINF